MLTCTSIISNPVVVFLVIAAVAITDSIGVFGFTASLSPTTTTTTTTTSSDHQQQLQQQRHVRDLLQVLDTSVRVFIHDDLKDQEQAQANTYSDPEPVFGACRAVCSALDVLGITPAPIPTIEQEQEQEEPPEELLTHFFGLRIWDAEFESLAATAGSMPSNFATVRDEDFSRRLMDAADVVFASATFALLPLKVKTQTLDALDEAVSHAGFLEARRMALISCSTRGDDSKRKAVTTNTNTNARRASSRQQEIDTITEKDKRVVKALYECAIEQLGPRFLRPLGFPCNQVGLRGFVAAANTATNTQRAAAALGRIWHAAQEAGPLILVPPAAGPDTDAGTADAKTDSLKDSTLVVAFSALGWNGIVRQEWGGTLRNHPNLVIAHAMDSCKSWFTTNPTTGAHDNGAWWDDSLAALVKPYGRICIVGESMGGTAALRFAKHATKSGTVVAFVPQIDLKDFSYSVRDDFVDDHKNSLLDSIQHSIKTTNARVVIHVGRDPDDLHQLTYLENAVHQHSVLGLRVDAPLSRYIRQASQAVGNTRLRVVKHDLEGHAMGAGLKAKGTLQETVLDDLLGTKPWP